MLPWPAQRPDLNPIEHVWYEMKRILRNLDTYPTTVDSLFLKITEIWHKLPAEYFNNLIAPMGSRCSAISNVRGGASKY